MFCGQLIVIIIGTCGYIKRAEIAMDDAVEYAKGGLQMF